MSGEINWPKINELLLKGELVKTPFGDFRIGLDNVLESSFLFRFSYSVYPTRPDPDWQAMMLECTRGLKSQMDRYSGIMGKVLEKYEDSD